MALSGWDPNKKYRITTDYTKVDDTLTNFPIMVLLDASNASELFAELQDKAYRIAVENGETGTQCYVEVERWYWSTTSGTRTELGTRALGERTSASSVFSTSYPAYEAWNGSVASPDSDRWASGAGTFNTTTGVITTPDSVWYQWDRKNEGMFGYPINIRYYNGTTNANGPKDCRLKMSDTGAFAGEEVSVCDLVWTQGSSGAWNTLLTISGTTPNKRYLRIYIDSIFPSNAGFTSVANWELTMQETYTYDAILWVRVPQLESSVPTTLYLYYDLYQSNNTNYVYKTSDVGSCSKGYYLTTKGTTEVSEGEQSKRILIATTQLTTFSGTGSTRVKIEAHTSGFTIGSCYIGAAAVGGSGYDFETTPTQITFFGNASVEVQGSGAIFSDWINYTVDKSKVLIVAFYHTTYTMWTKTSPTGITSYYKAGSDESSQTTVSGYSTGNMSCVIGVEEKPPSPLTRVWDDDYLLVYHTSSPPNVSLTDSTASLLHAAPTGKAASDWCYGPVRNTRAIVYNTTSDYHATSVKIPIYGKAKRTLEYFMATYNWSATGVLRWGGASANTRCTIVHGWNTGASHRFEYYTNYELFPTDAADFYGNFHHWVGSLDGTTVENSRLYKDGIELIADSAVGGTNTVATAYGALSVGLTALTSIGYSTEGPVFEVRMSRTVRSAAWNKASYYSNVDQLITFEPYHIYEINGYVQVGGSPAVRTVYLYDRNDGHLITSTTSSGVDGKFTLYTSTSGSVFINIMPEFSDSYNIIAQDKITPYQLV